MFRHTLTIFRDDFPGCLGRIFALMMVSSGHSMWRPILELALTMYIYIYRVFQKVLNIFYSGHRGHWT